MPRSPAYLFFPCSRVAEDQLNGLFDFVWPTAVAMWNLRWQLKGFLSEHPDAGQIELCHRFISSHRINPPHTLNYANLVKAQSGNWSEQTSELAKLVLTNSIAIYEAFLEELCGAVGLTGGQNTHLQFPTSAPYRGSHSYQTVLTGLAGARSPTMDSELYPGLVASRNNQLGNLEPMMVCYRCFKEMRNAWIHSGGRVNDAYRANAINAFSTTCNPAQLGLLHMTAPPTVAIGGMVNVELPNVVAFTAVLRKLIATLDAEFARVMRAEDILVDEWRAKFGLAVDLKRDPTRRYRQLKSRLHSMGLPSPASCVDLDLMLQGKGAYTVSRL